MYWTSITRLLHHLRTEKARLTIWLFTSGITFLLLYFFWEPKVRSFPKELVRIERMADTRPAAALQELERYDTTKCMPGAVTYYHFIALKTRYLLQPAYRIAPSELTKLVIDLEYLDPTPVQRADLYYYAGNMALRGNDITQSQGYLFKALALYERNGNTQMVERCYQQMERILEKRKTIKATERTMDDANSYNFVGEEQRLRKEKTRQELITGFVTLLLVALIVGFGRMTRRWNRRKRADMRKYARVVVSLRRTEEERVLLRQQLEEREAQLREMNAQSLMEDKKLGHIRRSDVYGRFHRVATNGATPASLTTDDWQNLADTIHEEFPRLNDVLRSIPHLSEMNLQMCLLVKADFKPVEIARILCRDKSTINSARRRLYERVFDEKGSPSQWDEFIRNI